MPDFERPPPADRTRDATPSARQAVSGSGAPLPEGLRQSMERSFGEDFAGVQVHSDGAARSGVVGANAHAFAVGEHIALGPEVAPDDRRVLAHELAHVVQQRRATGRSDAPSARAGAERRAEQAADSAAAGGSVTREQGGPVPAVQLDRLQFGGGNVLVVVDGSAVTVNGVAIRATAEPGGRITFNGREIVLDRSGVFRYRDRYTVCRSCNPDYYEGTRWTQRAGTTLPEPMGSFYDPTTRRWVLNRQPEVTAAALTPQSTAAPGPVDAALEGRVQSAHLAREQFEARVQQAMADGRTRAEAETLVRGRMQSAVDGAGLGTFESGQTYAVVQEDVGPGVTRRTTTGAVAGGETPTVTVPAPQLRTRLAQINAHLGENFVVNDQTLNHAEVRAVVRTPTASTYYVNREMCPVCQRFFLMESMTQGRNITVVDPTTTRVFSPDRKITEWRGDLVYERTASITRTAGVSSLEIGEHPSVTYSVRTVPRPVPVAPTGAVPEGPSTRPRPAGEPHVAPTVRPGVVEPEVPGRPGAIRPRGAGIRRFGLTAGRLLAEGVLTLALLAVEVIITFIVIPYLERLRRQLEERYRQSLQRQIQEYFERRLAATIQNRVLAAAEQLREIEDRDAQPYVNTTLRVQFERSWNIISGRGHGAPESIVDLDFVGMELVSVRVSDTPVEEGSDALVADDAHPIIGDAFSTDFSQVVRFPAMPPSYQELVNQFGDNPASRARAECFIATACYGTASAPAVDVLRAFRDLHLEPHRHGRRLVDWYYRTSPPVAGFLRRHAAARRLVRFGFVAPLAGVIRLCRLQRSRPGWLRLPAVVTSVRH